jgi:hypothetical protein
MILRRVGLVKFEDNVRDMKDRRRIVARGVFEYRDENDVEFRKSYTAPAGTPEPRIWDFAPVRIIKE